MNTKPLVSAIIIFLNEEKFLPEAIESVLAQTYPAWELLLVDDGSTDNSSEIAKIWAKRHPQKIRYLTHEHHVNRGMSASRNLGIQHAKGKYISFLDGDDVWLPAKLEEQVAILESHPEAALVYAPLKMWYSWTGEPEDSDGDHLYGVSELGSYPFKDELIAPPNLLKKFLRHEEYMPGGFLVKRRIMIDTSPYEDDFRAPYSDAVALVKLCLQEKVYASSKVWYLYRKHDASNTYVSWLNGTGQAEQKIYLDWVESYFSQLGVDDPELWRILERVLLPHRKPVRFVVRRQLIRLLRRLAPTIFSRLRLMRHSSIGVNRVAVQSD